MLDSFVVFLVRQLSHFLQILPHEAALWLGRFVGFILSKVHHRRRIGYANLKAAFGPQYSVSGRKKILQEHFLNLAQIVVEVLRFPKLNPSFLDRYVTVINRKGYEEIVRSPRGTILITPHFGNWELTQILSALVQKPLHVLARQQKHSKLDELLNELRSSHGSTAIHKGSAIREMIRTLKQGGMVGVLGDFSGGRESIGVRFFGRKTTAPTGIFEIAERTNSQILPCFMVRKNGPHHEIFIEPLFPLAMTSDGRQDLSKTVQNYYALLEQWISRFPSQWFWTYKRWKICFTKKILVLKDEKTGHSNQSEAVARELKTFEASYELDFQSVDVRFKSAFHKKLFYASAFFMLPFAQGRLCILKLFLTPECARILNETYADIIISAGSGLVPLSLFLKRENLAKSVILMKPSFPYLAKWFDLVIVPAHDRFSGQKGKIIETLISPNQVTPSLLEREAGKLLNLKGIKQNGRKTLSLFVGGQSKAYDIDYVELEKCLKSLRNCAEKNDYDLLITTSRRTNEKISALLKNVFEGSSFTKLLVIANEANVPNVAYGMLGLSDAALVTEDSVSMISEAVSSGKPVLVLQIGNGKLAKKHSRFHELLKQRQLVHLVDASNLVSALTSLNGSRGLDVFQDQSRQIQKALRNLL